MPRSAGHAFPFEVTEINMNVKFHVHSRESAANHVKWEDLGVQVFNKIHPLKYCLACSNKPQI